VDACKICFCKLLQLLYALSTSSEIASAVIFDIVMHGSKIFGVDQVFFLGFAMQCVSVNFCLVIFPSRHLSI